MNVIPQRVYFDPEDAAMDGLGWNVVDRDRDGGIAARYGSWAQAVASAVVFASGDGT